jgi:DNA repair protein RecO (recombination protein O)
VLKVVEGIIISETEYSETSKIVNILTKDGIIGAIAKGAKNLKSALRVPTMKLTYGTYQIYFHENKLSTIKEADIKDELTKIKKDILLISYMTYLCDLASQIMKQNNDSDIYNLLIIGLNKINLGLNPMVITNILEIKFLDYLGVGINLNSCAKCGSTHFIVTIDPDIGGYVCQNCYTDEIIYDEKTIKMLRMYYLVDLNSVTDLKISKTVINNINYFLNGYYDRYTGLYLKSKKFLEEMQN